jgi:ribonuclease-3
MLAYPQMNEGALSKWRASLVNEATLSEIALDLGIGEAILLGKSEERERGALRPRLLASVFEAVVAALYLDGGLEVARRFIEGSLGKRIEHLDFEFAADGKTRLQELTQKHFHDVPRYQVISAEGPEHAKTFEVQVLLKDKLLGEGQGSSRKAAEQAAALTALMNQEFLEMLKKQEGQK